MYLELKKQYSSLSPSETVIESSLFASETIIKYSLRLKQSLSPHYLHLKHKKRGLLKPQAIQPSTIAGLLLTTIAVARNRLLISLLISVSAFYTGRLLQQLAGTHDCVYGRVSEGERAPDRLPFSMVPKSFFRS